MEKRRAGGLLSIRAERLGKIIFLHAWLGLSVKKGTQLRAGGRWQIKAASFLTDLPGVWPGRARGGRNNGSHLQKNQTPSACTCLQVGKKQKRGRAAPTKGFQSPWEWVWKGWDECGHDLGQCGIHADIRGMSKQPRETESCARSKGTKSCGQSKEVRSQSQLSKKFDATLTMH